MEGDVIIDCHIRTLGYLGIVNAHHLQFGLARGPQIALMHLCESIEVDRGWVSDYLIGQTLHSLEEVFIGFTLSRRDLLVENRPQLLQDRPLDDLGGLL